MGRPAKYDFSGWATRNNRKCSDGRTILKHAFKDNDGATVPLVWNHDHQDQESVLGHAYLENREEGVYAYCSFNETEHGKHAKQLVQHGDIVALSIYANQLKQNSNKEVIHGNIREVSLVLAGANPGAYIETVLSHSDNDEEEAKIYHVDESDSLEMYHADPDPKTDDSKQEKNDGSGDKEETLQEIVDSMTEKQKQAVYLLVAAAIEENSDKKNQESMKHNIFDSEDLMEEKEMKHNIFEGITKDDGTELTHAEVLEIIKEAPKVGSLKEAFIAHGITDIGNLFPLEQNVTKTPVTVDRDRTWVGKVMASVKHTPFSRVRSMYIDITADAARAKGYVKGHQKVEEVVAAFKRKTEPQTVYKLQKLDRDDVIDITDFDVVTWLKGEMRNKLEEELARAFLIGDGRSVDSDQKINPINIRPVYGDNPVYTVKSIINTVPNDDPEQTKFAKALIKDVIKARKLYKGSGNPDFYTTEDDLTAMLLIEDGIGHAMYDTIEKLKTKLRVHDIITVPVMENITRAEGEQTYKLHGILVNLADYSVGADKGGAVSMFDDFDINYNKYEYLIETRCSGALVVPYSAITFEEKVAATTANTGNADNTDNTDHPDDGRNN